MSVDIFQGFDDSQKSIIPEVVSNKVQERWKTKCDEADDLKIELEKFKTNNEQQKFEFEKKVVVLKQQLGGQSKSKAEYESKIIKSQEKISDLEKELQQLSTKNATLQCQLQLTKSESESVSGTSAALSGTLDTKNKLIQELKAQMASLEAQVSSAMRAKAEAQIQSEETASLQNQLQYKEKKLSQERSLLRGQVELLQEQLEKRVHEALQQRNENSTALLQLRQDLHSATTECGVLKEGQQQLEKTAETKTKRVDELLETLREARENELKLEESFRMELSAQQKLVTIYNNSSEDHKAQCAELELGVSELRKLLEEASQQYGALERAKEHQAKEADQDIEKREELIHDLRDELDKVNMLLEASAKKEEQNALFSLTPAASAASQLMSKGLTLSQLYAEHLTATDKLNKLEEENTRLTRYIDQILQEIEERAPALQKQREEYLVAMDTVTALQQQLDDSTVATSSMREDGSELERRCKYLLREQESLTVENSDLSRQVTVLLTQVEAARAGVPPPQLEEEMVGGSGKDVVSAHLVCFRDVSELQQQNQKLLHTIRELTDQAEQAEKTALEKHMHDIQGELSEAQAELEQLRSGRDRIEALVENIGRQRDMYKSLLAQQGKGGSNAQQQREDPGMEDDSRPPSVAASDSSMSGGLQQLKEESNRLGKELEAAKKQLATAQEDLKQAQKRLTDQQKDAHKQMDDLRSTMEKTRSQNVKMISHAEYNEERLKTMQGNCESFQRQVNALEEKNTTLQSIVSRHEATLDHLRGEHMVLVKKLSHAEVIGNNLKEEKILFKETEARLLAERESAHRQDSSQALVLASLQSIKNNLEHKDSSDRMRLQNQITDLSDQNMRLKAKLETNTDIKEAHNKLSATEERLKASQREVSSNSQNLTAAREQLVLLQKRYDEAIDREKQLTIKLREAPLPPPPAAAAATAAAADAKESESLCNLSRMKDLEVQLVEERAKVSTLERTLDKSKQSLASLQKTCAQQEKELKQGAEAARTTLAKIEEVTSHKSSVERRLLELEEKMSKESEQAQARIAHLGKQLQQTQDDVMSSRDVVDTARTEVEAAKRVEIEAKKSIEGAQKEKLVLQQKYEREVMLHGTDLQALAKLKDQLGTHNQRLEKVTAEKIRAEETLKEVKRAGESLLDALKRERDRLKDRVTEMEEQNKGLLEQFTQLSDKMAAIQTKMTLGQDGNESLGNISLSDDEARTSEQLREVIKYLRRERELATGRCDVAQAEATRVKAQLDSANKHLAQLTQEIAQERENKQVSLDTASRYGEMMRKVHTVDALADSNRLLRQEMEAMKEKTEQANTKAEALQQQVEPLNTKLAEAIAEGETLQVEKKALDKDVEMYKKRTQELVEKLHRAKPEEFQRMQQELVSTKMDLQVKEADSSRLRMQVGQLQKNVQTMVTSRHGLQQQLTASKEEKNKLTEESKKLSMERARLVGQVGQQQDRLTTMASAQQQEQVKQLEQRNQLLQQLGEVKQREEGGKRDADQIRKELEASKRATLEARTKYEEADGKIQDLQKQIVQLRKIATKYKKAAETVSGDDSATAAAQVKELEANIATLKQQLEEANKNDSREQEGASRAKLMEAELTRVRQELDARSKETLALRGAATKQVAIITKRQEEFSAKKQGYESRIGQLEKEKEQLSGQLETLSLKLNVQQRQIMMDSATRQKQPTPGTSKPSTSGGSSSEKSSSETPPTANIKPLAAAAPSVTMSSPRPTPTATTPSRTIPTASIRPLAPPPTPTPGVGVVPPRDAHSEGLVSSSTVTLPQATVTPTPATPTATLPTTATTSTTQTTAATHTTTAMPGAVAATLTATVSPTPVLSQVVIASPSKSGAVVSAQAQVLSVAPAAATASTSATVAAVAPQEQMPEAMDQQDASTVADQLVTQAIAMVVPSQDQQQQPGPSSQKRKRDGEEQDEEEDDSKRSRVEQEASSEGVEQQETADATSSSSQQAGEARPALQEPAHDQDVILVDSDDEDEHERSEVMQQQRRPDDHMEESAEAEERHSQQQSSDEQQQEVVEAPSESHQPMHPQQPNTSNNNAQQQPSSSSAGHRQAALILPRPSANNDRVGSSGSSEGSLAAHPGHYDEGNDDSIVPSTPTLFAPRRAEGFPEPVSSPQRGASSAPRSPPADASSETGVSTSDPSSAPADSAAAATPPNSSQPQPGHHQEDPSSQEQPTGGNYTEADSMAAEVDEVEEDEEMDEEEEEEQGEEEEEEHDDQESPEHPNDEDDDDDDVVEIGDDDEEQNREAQQQPGEAAHHKSSGGGNEVSSVEEEVSGSSGPSSSYAAASSSSSSLAAPASPSSSSSRRITPITWGSSGQQEEDQSAVRGRGRGPYRSSDRIMGRRQQQEQQQQPSGRSPEHAQRGASFTGQRSTRGGQKARRSRQHHM